MMRRTVFHQLLPKRDDRARGAEKLRSFLARVAGPTTPEGLVRRAPLYLLKGKARKLRDSRHGFTNNGERIRPLDGKAGAVFQIRDRDSVHRIRAQPGGVFFMRGAVNHHKETPATNLAGVRRSCGGRFFETIDKNVVDHSPRRQAHMPVDPETLIECANEVAGDQFLNEIKGSRPFDQDLSHVGNVENPGCLPGRLVFIDDAGVLNGHLPAVKINEFGSGVNVQIVQRRAAEFSGHGHWGACNSSAKYELLTKGPEATRSNPKARAVSFQRLKSSIGTNCWIDRCFADGCRYWPIVR